MRIRSEEERQRVKPERDKTTIKLNIPVRGKSEISKDEICRGSSLCDFDLERKLNRLHLDEDDEYDYDDSSSSEDEEDIKELEKQLIAKCPDRIKDEKKAETRNYAKPYITATRSGVLQSGGVVTTNIDNFIRATNYYQIPKPVVEFVPPTSSEAVDEVNRFYSILNEEERQQLDDLVDKAFATSDTDFAKRSTPVNHKLRSKDSEICNSPDSSYGTMSPASVPPQSPYSLHSPNPPMEKMRLSESDSMSSDFELGSNESSFGPVDIVKLQTCNRIYGCSPSLTGQLVYAPQPRIITTTPLITKSSRPIKPDSEVIVHEFELKEPAEKRLKKKNLLKQNNINIEWAKAIEEAKPLENLNKEKIKNTEYEIEKLKRIIDQLRKNLIDLIVGGPKQPYFYERLFSRVKLYQRNHYSINILNGKDGNGHTPLYAAAVLRNDCPIIARLIADIVEDVGKLDDEDNTMLHYLARQGDSHAQVLAELLHSKRFDVNHKSIGSKTALHKAVECHSTKSCLACVKQFIAHDAQLQLQDFAGKTALHLAVTKPNSDPLLLKALLQSRTARHAIDVVDIDRNTPLHLAASRNDLPMSIQKEFIVHLVHSGARHDIRNNLEKTALMLVAPDRKEEIKNIFQRRM